MSAPPRVNYGTAAPASFAPVSVPAPAPVATSSPVGAIKTISLVGGLHTIASSEEIKHLEQYSIDQGIKTAMENTIVTSPDGLVTRPFLPDIDFIDGNNNTVGKREWAQPWSGTYLNLTTGTALTIYQTGQAVRYDRKVYCFWGLTYTAIGNQRSAGIVDTASVVFRDGANNTLDIWSPQRLDTNDALYAHAPIIYPNTRVCKIDLVPKYAGSGAFENLVFMGCVIEPDGDNIYGGRAMHI